LIYEFHYDSPSIAYYLVNSEGFVLATGKYLGEWGTSGSGKGEFNSPSGITADPSGNVYVLESGITSGNRSGNPRVQKFDENVYLSSWSAFGSGKGEFYTPYAIAVDSLGNVYVGKEEE
jgi:tripartite motif-containing protein 71